MHANKPPNVHLRTQSSQRSRLVVASERYAGPERVAAFARLVEELRALAAFGFDEPGALLFSILFAPIIKVLIF